jgi:hypothetical protein
MANIQEKLLGYQHDPVKISIQQDHTGKFVGIELDDSGNTFKFYIDDIPKVVKTIRTAISSDSHYIWLKHNENRFESEHLSYKISAYNQYFINFWRPPDNWSGFWLEEHVLLHITKSLEELQKYLVINEVMNE